MPSPPVPAPVPPVGNAPPVATSVSTRNTAGHPTADARSAGDADAADARSAGADAAGADAASADTTGADATRTLAPVDAPTEPAASRYIGSTWVVRRAAGGQGRLAREEVGRPCEARFCRTWS